MIIFLLPAIDATSVPKYVSLICKQGRGKGIPESGPVSIMLIMVRNKVIVIVTLKQLIVCCF
jgi:hypothetical protein